MPIQKDKPMFRAKLFLLLCTFFFAAKVYSQDCTTLGQKPSSAFPVCGTDVFFQSYVPLCVTQKLPNKCPAADQSIMMDKNPFWYKFTCYIAGTLGFNIVPYHLDEDYNWQLFDVTGRNPADVFKDTSLVVSYNWSRQRGGFTGATNYGLGLFNCRDSLVPRHNEMPTLRKGHDYLLLVSHYDDNQNGYVLTFEGGTASLVDTTRPRLKTATTTCNGAVNIKLTKKINCTSLAKNGSDFLIPWATIVSATGIDCSNSFDVDSIILQLASPLAPGTYTVTAKNGTDGNTVLGNCDVSQPVGDQINFITANLQPTIMDSITAVKCSPATLQLVFKKPIRCNSIAADGSDFNVTGPAGVIVKGAKGTCNSKGLASAVEVQLAAPILSGGNYQVHLTNGTDGNTLFDECGLTSPAGTLDFIVSDPVSAQFSYNINNGCRLDTVTFSNAGSNGIVQWLWRSNGNVFSTQQNPSRVFPAATQFTIKLFVSNGVCTDSSETTFVSDDEVRAAFETNNIICPEDSAVFKNTSIGNISSWLWNFGNGITSTSQTPPPQIFPRTGMESGYTALLTVVGANGCVDITREKILVLKSCLIAIPNAFTPNGDGMNDFFYPSNTFKADDLDFRIYNRLGGLAFQTRDRNKKWDGKINGIPQPQGIYVWSLRYRHRDTQKKYSLRGTMMLIR